MEASLRSGIESIKEDQQRRKKTSLPNNPATANSRSCPNDHGIAIGDYDNDAQKRADSGDESGSGSGNLFQKLSSGRRRAQSAGHVINIVTNLFVIDSVRVLTSNIISYIHTYIHSFIHICLHKYYAFIAIFFIEAEQEDGGEIYSIFCRRATAVEDSAVCMYVCMYVCM